MAIGITGANNGYSRTAADNRFLGRDGGTINGNLTVTGTLSTTLLEAISANITILDIRQYELSGFNVSGNATIQGTISASGNLLTASGVTAGGGGSFNQDVTVAAGGGRGFKIGGAYGMGSGFGWTSIVPDTVGLFVGYGFNINATPLLSRYAVSFLNTGTQSKLAIGLDNSFNSAVASLSTLTFYVGSSATMSLTDNGRVGIGTSTPTSVLDIPGSGDTSLPQIIVGKANHGGWMRFRRGSDGAGAAQIGYGATDGGAGFNITSGGGQGYITLTAAGGPVNVYSSNTNPFSFAANGSFGVGTIYPNAKVDVLDTTLAGSTGLSGSILNLTQTWATSGAPTSIRLDVTDTSSSASSLLMDLRIGSRSSYSFGKTTLTLPPSANSGIVWPGVSLQNQTCSITRKADDSLDIVARLGGGKYITIGGDGYGLGIFNGFLRLNTGLREVYLSADDNNIFAQRNSGSPQAYRLYNTYSNATTFERLNLRWDTNVIKIGTEKGAAGGAARDLAFETDATTRMHITSAGNIGIATTAPGNILHLDCTLNRGILLTNSTQAPNRANYFINAGNGGAYNCLNISESYDNILYGHIQAYARSLYLGGFANATSVASVTVLNDQNKLDLLQLRQGLIGSSTVFKVASSGDTTIYGSVSAVRYLGLQDSLSGNPILVGGNSTGSDLLIGTNDNYALNLETAGTTKMTITSAGNVGIGTTAPLAKLQVGDSSGSLPTNTVVAIPGVNPRLSFSSNDISLNFGGYIQTNYSGGSFMTLGTRDNLVDTNGLTLKAGNVGIGTTAPSTFLEIVIPSTGNYLGQGIKLSRGSGYFTLGNGTGTNNFVPIFTGKGTFAGNATAMGFVGLAGDDSDTVNGVVNFSARNSSGSGTITSTQKAFTFQNYTTELVTILATGNVGIGTTAPSTKLEIVTTGSVDGIKINRAANDRSAWLVDEGTGAGALYLFNGSNSNTIYITGNGDSFINSGNLGIGMSGGATAKLDIADTTLAGSGALSGSALNISQTWNTTGNPTAVTLNVTNSASGAASNFLNLQVGGSSRFSIRRDGAIAGWMNSIFGGGIGNLFSGRIHVGDYNFSVGSNTNTRIAIEVDGSDAANALLLNSEAGVYWSSLDNTANIIALRTGADLALRRDTSNTLAQRNGVNPQTFRLYNTYTDPISAFERLNIKWDANVIKIGTEKGSTGGVARNLAFVTDNTTRMTITSSGFVGIGVVPTETQGESLYLSNIASGTNTTYLRIDNINSNGSIGVRLGSYASKADFYYDNVTTQTYLRGLGSALNIGTFSGDSNAYVSFTSFQQERMRITGAGNVGIGITAPAEKLDVVGNVKISGHLSAATKSFLIDHPTKEGKKLQYGVVESNQHSVLVRGKTAENIIELPEEWTGLVHEDSVTVQLTSIGSYQQLFVISQDNQRVVVGGSTGQYNYTIYGERKDVDKLQTVV